MALFKSLELVRREWLLLPFAFSALSLYNYNSKPHSFDHFDRALFHKTRWMPQQISDIMKDKKYDYFWPFAHLSRTVVTCVLYSLSMLGWWQSCPLWWRLYLPQNWLTPMPVLSDICLTETLILDCINSSVCQKLSTLLYLRKKVGISLSRRVDPKFVS